MSDQLIGKQHILPNKVDLRHSSCIDMNHRTTITLLFSLSNAWQTISWMLICSDCFWIGQRCVSNGVETCVDDGEEACIIDEADACIGDRTEVCVDVGMGAPIGDGAEVCIGDGAEAHVSDGENVCVSSVHWCHFQCSGTQK